MNRKGISRSALFLTELIIVILFFAIASTITLQLFVKASGLADRTSDLNGGIMVVQSAAEIDKSTDLMSLDQKSRFEYYDENWEKTDEANKVYTLTSQVVLENRWAGTMAIFTYTLSARETVIYELTAKKYYSNQFYSNQIYSILTQGRGETDE